MDNSKEAESLTEMMKALRRLTAQLDNLHNEFDELASVVRNVVARMDKIESRIRRTRSMIYQLEENSK